MTRRRERRRIDLNLFHRPTVRKEAAMSERLKQNFEIIMVEMRNQANKRIRGPVQFVKFIARESSALVIIWRVLQITSIYLLRPKTLLNLDSFSTELCKQETLQE